MVGYLNRFYFEVFNKAQVAIANVKRMMTSSLVNSFGALWIQRSAYGGKERFKLV